MKSFLALVVTITLVSFQYVSAKAGTNASNGDVEEPAVQKGENVGAFSKGKSCGRKWPSVEVKNEVTMGDPTFKGTGCEEGTVGAALTPDKKTLSVAFDEYFTEAGLSSGVKKSFKACTMIVPFNIPKGLQFTIVKVDQRGYNFLPDKAKNRYISIYSLQDPKSKKQIGHRIRRQMNFTGPVDDVYTITSEVHNTPLWSPCGKNVNFKVETRAITTTNKDGDDTLATIDTLDMSPGNVGYQLIWRKCK